MAVTGSSGLIGTALTALLTTSGHRVVPLVRRLPRAGERYWQPEDPAAELLDGVDAVIHLAGASIGGRFTAERKHEIRTSRIQPTRRLAELAAATQGLRAFVTASAIGIYGPDRGDEVLTEASPRGDGFLADVVAGWEDAATPATAAGIRTVQVRTGIVQTPRGGMLRLLSPLFEAGLGGRLGDGKQWLAWIGLDDLLDIYRRAVLDEGLSGPVNAVAPEPVRNTDYTRTLAAVLRRPAVLPVPGFGPRLLLGDEGAREIAQASQYVLPERLTGAGHRFRSPNSPERCGTCSAATAHDRTQDRRDRRRRERDHGRLRAVADRPGDAVRGGRPPRRPRRHPPDRRRHRLHRLQRAHLPAAHQAVRRARGGHPAVPDEHVGPLRRVRPAIRGPARPARPGRRAAPGAGPLRAHAGRGAQVPPCRPPAPGPG